MLYKNNYTPLLERVESVAKSVSSTGDICVPVHDATLYAALLQEATRLAIQQDDPNVLVMMDADTAVEIHEGGHIVEKARHVVLFGNAFPMQWEHAANIVKCPCVAPMQPEDRLLLVLSNTISLALFGQHLVSYAEDGRRPFQGGWTVQRSTVFHLAEALLGADKKSLLEDIPFNSSEEDRISSAAMRLTALHAHTLESREHLASVEKSDLLSVLEILKAISAKRRAHDILFVFVEQIARIIDMERCSVVRVWDSESIGHVLASHEDSKVTDHLIELAKYPEIREAIETSQPIIIHDVANHPLTMEFSRGFAAAGITSLLVIPIVLRDRQVGSLLLRAARRNGAFSMREVSFFQIVAEAAANALERAHLFESIQLANERLERLAITDSLTGVYNRRYFHERVEQEFARSIRYKLPFSCLIFDVDDFKKINDSYGHLAGDAVLREIADRTAASIRKVDILARYGGEEFVVLLPQTDIVGAAVEAERIRVAIAERPHPEIPPNVRVSVSIGVAAIDHDAMHTYEDLLRAADAALYEAKRNGKNRVVVNDTPDKE